MSDVSPPIGGTICQQAVTSPFIDSEETFVAQHIKAALWDIFVEIGRHWGNLADDSLSVKSSWLEFIEAKTSFQPSYAGEYTNAVSVMQELIEMYGDDAFDKLFFANNIPAGPPTTRLAHAKHFVVDEFIRVQITAGGFKGFGDPHPYNYAGYLGGSRYNRLPRVRAYIPVSAAAAGDAS